MLHFLRNVVNTLSASSVSRKSPKYYKRVTALARQSLSECLLVKAVTLFILINYIICAAFQHIQSSVRNFKDEHFCAHYTIIFVLLFSTYKVPLGTFKMSTFVLIIP